MLAKFASDAKLEQAQEENRALERQNYKARADEQRAERLSMYEQEKAGELAEVAAVQEAEVYKQRVVEEARRRLLLEHAARLEGFLPKSTLVSEDEHGLVLQHGTRAFSR